MQLIKLMIVFELDLSIKKHDNRKKKIVKSFIFKQYGCHYRQ